MAAATVIRDSNAVKMLSAGQGSRLVQNLTFSFPTTDTTCTVNVPMNTIFDMKFSHQGSEQVYGPSTLYSAGYTAGGTVTITRSAGTTSGLQVNMRVEGF